MRMLYILISSLFFTSSMVLADYDPALEAEEASARAASQQAELKRKAEADRMTAEYKAKQEMAIMNDKRKRVGKAAEGKSDAEVSRMYDEKVAADTQEALDGVAEAQKKMSDPNANAQMKAATGKSMQEIMNMSDAEREAWAAELEKNMGGFAEVE